MGRKIGFKHTEETKQKIRFSKLGEKNPNFGLKKRMLEDTKIEELKTIVEEKRENRPS